MNSVFLIEFFLFVGGALAWAGWELWSVRRSKFGDPPLGKKAGASEDTPRHPEG